MRLPDLRKLRKRAEQLVVEGQYDDAAALYRGVLAAGDANGKAWYGLGYAYYKLGRAPQALLALREASERGYAPAARMLAHITRKQARAEEDYPFPVFDDAPEAVSRQPVPRDGARENVDEMRRKLAHRVEELDAFLDRLGARALTLDAYADWEVLREVRRVEAAHEAAAVALVERRRAWKAVEARLAKARDGGCTEEETVMRARAAAEAAKAFEEAEAGQERLRGALREARRALARAVVQAEPRLPELAPLVREVEKLQKEVAWFELQTARAEADALTLTDSNCRSGAGAR